MAFKETQSRPVLLQSTRLIRTARAGKSCAVAGLSGLYKDERPGVSLAENPEYNRAITARRFHAAERFFMPQSTSGRAAASLVGRSEQAIITGIGIAFEAQLAGA